MRHLSCDHLIKAVLRVVSVARPSVRYESLLRQKQEKRSKEKNWCEVVNVSLAEYVPIILDCRLLLNIFGFIFCSIELHCQCK